MFGLLSFRPAVMFQRLLVLPLAAIAGICYDAPSFRPLFLQQFFQRIEDLTWQFLNWRQIDRGFRLPKKWHQRTPKGRSVGKNAMGCSLFNARF